MSALEGLKRQRSTFKGVLTKLSNFASAIDEESEETVEELRVKVSRAKELLEKIIAIEASIFAIDTQVASKLEEAEEAYYNVVSKLNKWINNRGISELSVSNNDTTLNVTSTNSGSEVRLAKLQIPTFSGDYTEWQSFFDLFHSSVHSKHNTNPVQKFQYLMGLLRGDAFSLVKHFKITEANYIEALKKLKQRYDRKRHTINAFIRKFIEQPNINIASASNIRKLLDTSDETIRGLKALGDKAEVRDPWLIYLLLQKLDDDTRSLWAQENTEKEFPTVIEFFEFLIKRTDALESVKMDSIRPTTTRATIPGKSKNSFATTIGATCIACNKEQHRLIDCFRFKELSVEDRRNLVGTNKRCFNCLNPGHSSYECRIRGRCSQCSKKHHTLLHLISRPNALTANTEATNDSPEENKTSTLHIRNDECIANQGRDIVLKCTVQTILPTAIINVLDSLGTPCLCRALLDTASQSSFITESLVQKLGLPRRNCRSVISGIGQVNSGRSHGITTLRLSSRFNSVELSNLDALIIPRITSSLPAFEFDISCIKNLSKIRLADPIFYKPGTIDILLGADILFDLLENSSMELDSRGLKAQKSKVGWVIGGRYEEETRVATQSFATLIDIDVTLQKFWTIEDVPQTSKMTEEEQECEDWFKTTTRPSNDGRFIVKLPFKETPNDLGSTYQQAVSRLLAVERRFQTNIQFRQLYQQFMTEYKELNHMQPRKLNGTELQQTYMLPHHGVFKNSSSTTKLRVVFDASAKSTTGASLNQKLKIGPNVQSFLFQILTRFRQYPYVLVGDIEKMYRQVLVDKEDTKHQIILWRDDDNQIRPYALNTVTYGMASASFMATRCLKELAILYLQKHPEACRAIERDIYVDDLMTGAPTLPELLKLNEDVLNILESGGFNLRKCRRMFHKCGTHSTIQDLIP